MPGGATTTLHLNDPAPIPVGHVVEVTELADDRPEPRRRRRPPIDAPFRFPVLVDVDTGIRYMNHAHASRAGNGGNAFRANGYPLRPCRWHAPTAAR